MKLSRSVYIHRTVSGEAWLLRLDRKPRERARISRIFPASRSDDFIAGFCDAAGLKLVKKPEGGPR